MKNILAVKNIEKYYGNKDNVTKVLDDISFSIDKGEFIGIMGPSGSGKTTLLNCISTIDSVTTGSIEIEGCDITRLKGEKLRQHRRNMQMVFQDPATAFNPKMKVKDIICEPLLNFGLIKKSQKEEVAKEYLEMVELPAEFMDRYPHNMSGGQRQRIGIARAFTYGGSKSRVIYDPNLKPIDFKSLNEVKNSQNHTINHFYEKLLKLKDLMNTNTAKEIAQKRHKFMEDFLNEFYSEWNFNEQY